MARGLSKTELEVLAREYSSPSASVDERVRELHSNIPGVSRNAVMYLGRRVRRQRDREALCALLDALDSHLDPWVRADAAGELDHSMRNKEFFAMAVDPLIRHLLDKNEDRFVRRACAESLVDYHRQDRALNALLAVLGEDPDDYVRAEVAYQFGVIPICTPRVVASLLVASEDRCWKVRAGAVRSLAECDDLRAIKAVLYRMANDTSAQVRQSAATSMIYIRGQREAAIDALRNRLADRSWRPRWGAALALCSLGVSGAADAAAQVENDPKVPREYKQDIREEMARLPAGP